LSPSGRRLQAVDDKKLGPVYVAKVQLLKSAINRGDKVVSLGAGMTVTADIKTGHRTMLSYLLSPLEEVGHEAGRER
jgi:multidrug efflux pump subunit AcrA (membrane-fusion protein)